MWTMPNGPELTPCCYIMQQGSRKLNGFWFIRASRKNCVIQSGATENGLTRYVPPGDTIIIFMSGLVARKARRAASGRIPPERIPVATMGLSTGGSMLNLRQRKSLPNRPEKSRNREGSCNWPIFPSPAEPYFLLMRKVLNWRLIKFRNRLLSPPRSHFQSLLPQAHLQAVQSKPQRAAWKRMRLFRCRQGDPAVKIIQALVSIPTGHVTPTPPIPQYPCGFFAKYCW